MEEERQKDRIKRSIALGYFDGPHRGHAAVVDEAIKAARELGAQPAVVTFDMSALRAAGKGAADIFPEEQRRAVIAQWGIADYRALDFGAVSPLSGSVFVQEILARQLGALCICCGEDFRFGHDRSCGINELSEFCAKLDIELRLVHPVLEEGEPISTSRIKQALGQGDMPAAARMLGREYGLALRVQKGKQLAHRLGFPTINQSFPKDLVAPRFGVYESRVTFAGIAYRAISNIGVRPTLESSGEITIETHILDFEGDLYGQIVAVDFLRFLRDERRFESAEELREQVECDIRVVASY